MKLTAVPMRSLIGRANMKKPALGGFCSDGYPLSCVPVARGLGWLRVAAIACHSSRRQPGSGRCA